MALHGSRQALFTALALCALACTIVVLLVVSSTAGDSPTILASEKAASLVAFEKSLPSHIRKLLNTKVNPCEDFHEYACGAFEANSKIPAEKTSWTYSWDMDETNVEKEIHSIIEADTGKTGLYYRACMNEELVIKRGSEPVQKWVKLAQSVNDSSSLGAVVAKLHIIEVPAFFDWFIGTSDQDPTLSILYLDKGGISVPDATYYTEEEKLDKHGPPMVKYLMKALILAGFNAADAETMASDTISIEAEIAAQSEIWESQNYTHSISSLQQAMPHFGWNDYFKAWGHSDIKNGTLFLTNPSWFFALDEIIGGKKITELRNYLVTHVVINCGPLLTPEFLDNDIEIQKDLYGVSARIPRWKKCTKSTKHALPFLVSQLFVEKYFPPAAKALATEMLESIREAFQADLKTVSWMTNETKSEAETKLKNMFFEVGYPAKWPQYDFFVRMNSYFENALRSAEWRSITKWERLRHKVSRRDWDTEPMAVNAFYYNGVNGVFVPAGILQPPFFDAKESLAHNFGSIGAIMGHELTHGFDGTGAQFNSEGKRKDWWDPKTLDEFDDRKTCVADLYTHYTVFGKNVSGINTMDEDIADIGGLKMSYRAFLLTSKKKGKIPTLYERREFWTSYAQTWCGKTRKETAEVNLLTDEHAPDQVRISGAVSQNPDFAKDFWCPVGTKLNPPSRCVLW